MKHQNASSLILVGVAWVLAAGPARSATMTITTGKIQSSAGSVVEVPITVQGAKGMSCLQMALVYDATVLEAKEVERGLLLPENALFDFNKETPGRLGVAFLSGTNADRTGLDSIEKDGVVLKVKFTVLGKPGQSSPLKVINVKAADKSDLWLLTDTQDGEFTVAAGGLSNSLWYFVAAGVGVLLILLIVLLTRRSSAQPAAPTTSHAAPPRFAPDEPTFQHTCTKCAGVIRLPRSMVGQTFQCAACGTTQTGGQ